LDASLRRASAFSPGAGFEAGEAIPAGFALDFREFGVPAAHL